MTMPMWQTMETAPKDGRRILVVWNGVTRIASWGPASNTWVREDSRDAFGYAADGEVTFWMEIPSHLKDKISNG